MKQVLLSPLPKAFDEADNGGAKEMEAGQSIVVGAGVNCDAITAASEELKRRMKEEVVHPIGQWLAAYRTIRVRAEGSGLRGDAGV